MKVTLEGISGSGLNRQLASVLGFLALLPGHLSESRGAFGAHIPGPPARLSQWVPGVRVGEGLYF